MHCRIKKLTAALIFGVSVATLVQATARAATRPADVPADYVVTPFGYKHPSCVYSMDSAHEKMGRDEKIVKSDGSTRTLPPCAYPTYHEPNGNSRSPNASTSGPDSRLNSERVPTTNGWVVDGEDLGEGAIYSMAANFSVPSYPASADGQTVYLFPGLSPSGGNEILQPVLAFNQDGNWWGATVWRASRISGNTTHNLEVRVLPGWQLDTLMAGTGCSGGVCSSWTDCFTNLDNIYGQEDCLTTDAQNEPLTEIFGGVLEVYGVDNCNELPQAPEDGDIFNQIFVTNTVGTQIFPKWNIHYWGGVSPNCSYVGTFAGSGRSFNQVELQWTP